MTNKSFQVSIGREAAIALGESNWWEGKIADEIVKFQLFTAEVTMPFAKFHEAMEIVLGRPVLTHEFAGDRIVDEYLGDLPAPTMQQIIEMIPEDKRVLVS